MPTTFTRNQRVVVVDHTGHLIHDESRIIVRVGARCVTLDNGSQWTLNGGPYAKRDRGVFSRRIRSLTEADEVEFARRKHAARLGDVKWRELPAETLAAVKALVDKARGFSA